jgi:recombination protein RecR
VSKTSAKSIHNLREQLSKLPGVGDRTAERLAYHIVGLDRREVDALANAIQDVKRNVKQCSRCFLLSESDPCHICQDTGRDRSVLCVVEESRDAESIEKSGEYRGLYHVLCGRLAPLDGIEPDDLTLDSLRKRVLNEDISEVILATNLDIEGDTTANLIIEVLDDLPVKISRLARGLPSGSHLEYANSAMLAEALEGRKSLK